MRGGQAPLTKDLDKTPESFTASLSLFLPQRDLQRFLKFIFCFLYSLFTFQMIFHFQAPSLPLSPISPLPSSSSPIKALHSSVLAICYNAASSLSRTQTLFFLLLRNCQTDFYNGGTNVHSHQQWRSVPLSPHPRQHLLSPEFLILAILTGVR